MLPRGQRFDARILAHVGILALQPTTNFAYMRYDMIAADIRKVSDQWENARLAEMETIRPAPAACRLAARRNYLTEPERIDGTGTL